MRPARPHCAQEEREPDGSPSSCESPSPPSGRAARVKISDAFRLPPNCHCGRQGIGCHPRGVRGVSRARTVPGRGVAFTRTVTVNLTSPALPPLRSGAKPNRCDVIANQILSTECGQNLFAVAGSREPPPAGVTRKRGQGPLLPARAAQAHRSRRPQAAKFPARKARAHTPPTDAVGIFCEKEVTPFDQDHQRRLHAAV